MRKQLLLFLCSLLAAFHGYAQQSVGYQDNWPKPDGTVYAVVRSGTTVYIAGSFSTVGGQSRNNIAALDATTGVLTSWAPNADNTIYALAVSGDTVYAGGAFTSIGGQSRGRIAALDSATGNATSWNPNATTGSVRVLALSGNLVYAGGTFTTIGGQSRNRLVALDAATGNATSWNPSANSGVYGLAVSGSTVYAGGPFTSIGGQARRGIAALDTVTGSATSWNPNPNNSALTIAVSGNTLYAGGHFTTMGGQSRKYIAALDIATGSVTSWNPNASAALRTLFVNGNAIYAGGDFIFIGGQTRVGIAALDSATGNATPWNPDADDIIYGLAVSGSTVYAGGSFYSMGGNSTRNYFMPLVDSNNLVSASVSIAASANPVCAGASVTFTATPTNATSPTYQWTKNGTDISAQTAATYTTNMLANGDIVRCQMTNGGTTLTSNAVTMTINPLPVASISTSGPNPFCVGTTVSLAASPSVGAYIYQWMLGATTLSSTTAQHSATAAGSYTVTVTDSNGCVGTSPAFALNTKTPPAAFNITAGGATTFCAGGSVTLMPNISVSTAAAYPNYQWSNNGVAITGATSVSYPATATGSYTITVSDNGGCGRTSTTRAVTVNPLPAAAISTNSPNPLCAGSTAVLNASPTGAGNTYRWMRGATTLSATGAQYTTNAAGSYTVRLTDANGCVGTSPAFVLTTKTPPASFNLTASGATAFCAGGSTTLSPNLSANLSGFSLYQWSNNGVAIAGATALSYPATASGSYTITVSDSNGCGRTSVARPVTVNPNPTASISGQNPFCAGSTSVLSASPTGTGITYQWMLGASNLSATGMQYTANAAGSYKVKVKDANGCAGTSPAFVLTSTTPPAAFNLTAGGVTTFCDGGSVTLAPNASANLSGFPNYQWSNNGSAIAGATAMSYPATAAGSYTITASDSNGCGRTSVARAVTVNPNPTATITPLGSTTIGAGGSVTLQANAGTGYAYQWFKDNVVATGATGRNALITSSGSYTVRVTGGGCFKMSSAVVVTQTGAKESLGVTAGSDAVLDGYFSFSAFPNPASDKVTVRTNGAVSQSAMVQVMTLTGAAVKEVEMKDSQTEIDLSGMATGVYLLRYKDAEGRTGIIRLVKQ